jgi:NAD(P)-dependent dehydrogenase (short-subunit alcohol dehydrogenase family)
MSGRLTGKVAMVTGCGSIGPGWGNGKAISVLFAREGAAVFGIDRALAAATETAGLIHAGAAVARSSRPMWRWQPMSSAPLPAASRASGGSTS